MSDDKPMTEEEIAAVQREANGWRGRFVFREACEHDRGVGAVADFVDYDEALVFVPEGEDEHDHDVCAVISADHLANVNRSLATMLNAVPRLLREVNRLREYVHHADAAIGVYRTNSLDTRDELARLTRDAGIASAALDYYMERLAEAEDDVGIAAPPLHALAIGGERCECCGRAFVEDEAIACFEDDDGEDVVAHWGPCPFSFSERTTLTSAIIDEVLGG